MSAGPSEDPGDGVRQFDLDRQTQAMAELRRRLRATRWPDPGPVDDWSQGVPIAYLRDVCRYWSDEYDWDAALGRLVAHPNLVTRIDGLDIHFIHSRSPVRDAVPLLLTHGWPSLPFEFLEVLPHLTNPSLCGGPSEPAFHVVAPSLPGYGFSAAPRTPGWGVDRIADAWHELMARLGYASYFAHGGDWGAFVTTSLAIRHPVHVAGIHLTCAVVTGSGEDESATDEERAAVARIREHRRRGSGYSKQQATRPQTLGYALADSPAGQCAWILEKYHAWTDHDGDPRAAIPLDRMLDTITLYWLTNCAASSARLYWESYVATGADRRPVSVPATYSVFPEEVTQPSARWLRARYLDLRYYRRVERGGHFAALEQPDLFVREIRAGIRACRDGGGDYPDSTSD